MIHKSLHDAEDAQGDGGQLRQSHGDDESVSDLETSGFITENGTNTVSGFIFAKGYIIGIIIWFTPEVWN